MVHLERFGIENTPSKSNYTCATYRIVSFVLVCLGKRTGIESLGFGGGPYRFTVLAYFKPCSSNSY